jgi:hypothetical protein
MRGNPRLLALTGIVLSLRTPRGTDVAANPDPVGGDGAVKKVIEFQGNASVSTR